MVNQAFRNHILLLAGKIAALLPGLTIQTTLALPALSHSTQIDGENTGGQRKSPVHRGLHPKKDLKILYFIDHIKGASVLINGGSQKGILPGAVLQSMREVPGLPHQQAALIPTGTLKVVQLGQDYAVAKILHESPEAAKNSFIKFPKIMAGDSVKVPAYRLRSAIQVLPRWERRYNQLFRIPGAHPESFELSPEGMNRLREEVSIFGSKNISGLFVRGHTDAHGQASQNQIESYQRALTVRQFLIDNLGFDPERVIALGMGETDLKNKSRVYGAAEENRRIEISVINTPEREQGAHQRP